MSENQLLTEQNKKNMQTFLRLIYSDTPGIVDRWEMNEEVFEIVVDMIERVLDCSNKMDYIPQPGDLVGGRGGARYAKKVLESIAERVKENQSKNKREIYFLCQSAVSINYRTPLEMAGMGL